MCFLFVLFRIVFCRVLASVCDGKLRLCVNLVLLQESSILCKRTGLNQFLEKNYTLSVAVDSFNCLDDLNYFRISKTPIFMNLIKKFSRATSIVNNLEKQRKAEIFVI